MKIGVIGLGLIGGSILKALAKAGHELYAVSFSSALQASDFAKIASGSLDIVKDCDVVFVCNEMSKTLKTLDSLEHIVRPNAIVCDVASLKGFVSNVARPYNFIPTHPMAGSEKSGFSASTTDLFESAKWVITEQNDTLEALIKQMGATPVFMDSKDHDFAAAQISHLPMFVAFGMCGAIENNKAAQVLASSGFRDTTRLALTNSTLAADMLDLNAENIDRALEMLINELTNLKNLSYGEKIDMLEKISEDRKNLYDENGKNKATL